MKPTQNALLATIGITSLITALVVIPSRSGHSAGGPIPVQVSGVASTSDIDNPARQPVQFTLLPNTNSSNQAISSYTVPAGKRLVIEYIFAQMLEYDNQGGFSSMYLVTTVGHNQAYYPLASLSVSTDQETNQTVRIYADPGSSVQAQANTSVGTAVSGETIVSGYLVSLP